MIKILLLILPQGTVKGSNICLTPKKRRGSINFTPVIKLHKEGLFCRLVLSFLCVKWFCTKG